MSFWVRCLFVTDWLLPGRVFINLARVSPLVTLSTPLRHHQASLTVPVTGRSYGEAAEILWPFHGPFCRAWDSSSLCSCLPNTQTLKAPARICRLLDPWAPVVPTQQELGEH